MTDYREAQLRYEIEADNEAAAAQLERLQRESTEGMVDHPRATRFIAAAFGKVRDIIKEYQDTPTRGRGGIFKNWLRQVPAEIAAVIAIRECISQCTSYRTNQPATVQALALAIGKLYELEVRIGEATRVNPVYMEKVERNLRERNTTSKKHIFGVYHAAYSKVMGADFDSRLSNSEAIHLGKFGLDACYQAGIVELVRTYGSRGSLLYYELSPEVHTYVTGYTMGDVRKVLAVEAGAMLCPPDKWTDTTDGGYLSLRRKANAPLLSMRKIRKEERDRLKAEFNPKNLPVIFRVANYLQEVPYALHKPTLDAIRRVWSTGGGIMGVPPTREPKKPECPLPPEWDKADGTLEEIAEFNQWKRRAAEYYSHLREWRSKVREVGGFIRAANKAAEKVWFPVYLDSRGRWYYRGLPNPQGSDLSKGVLHFADKKPLGERGLFWLKVHIANSFGYDKTRMVDRAKWTDDNWATIERALDRPEDHPDVWGDDAPWCMFSAAWELREAYRSGDPTSYCTGIPIHMDATCSGIQHFAALLRDPVAARAVNLDDAKDMGPKMDIYMAVAHAAMKSVEWDAEHAPDENTRTLARFWIGVGGIPRALAKKPVMTYLYGATLLGTTHHVQDFVEDELPHVKVPNQAAFQFYQYIGKKLFDGIEAAVPAAAEAMRWLQQVASNHPRNTRMEWTAPTGFPVQHDYQSYHEIRIKLKSCGVLWTAVREYDGGTRAHSMRNAISPNFVHALDAAHLTMVADVMRKDGLGMVAIHDSFGTHPCDVDTMQRHIREQFVKLYTENDILGNFCKDVGTDLEPPKQGDFDLTQVLDSEFFFS